VAQIPVQQSAGFGSNFTDLGKRLLIMYGLIYIIELLCEHWLNIPIVNYLKIYPVNHPDFQLFQLITHPFIHDPNAPISFLINCLIFYFFAGPVETAFGQQRFVILFYFSALGGVLTGLIFSIMSGFNTPFLGMLPSLLSMIVVFGLLNPEATILLMFILPVKAKYLSYGTVLLTFLTFLAKANPHGAYHLGGILFGWLFLNKFKKYINPDLIYLKYLEWQLKKKKSQFTVIDGGKDDDQPPTIH
jgi:membrane associated rhomboid family serine protease